MHKFNIAFSLSVAALALIGCNAEKEAAKSEAAKGEAAKAEAAANIPGRAAGLWEQTVEIKGQPASTNKMCLGEGTDAAALAKAPSECTPKIAAVAGGWTVNTVCAMGNGAKTESKTRITGDMAREMVSKTTAVVTMKGAAPQTQEVTLTARRLGDCPPDMAPGAMEQNGVIIDPSGMKN